MKIIIPMAGKGVRLYPHTLNTPKPFLYILGKPIIKRILNSLHKVINFFNIRDIIFIIQPNKNTEKILNKISSSIGLNTVIYHQKQPFGTADALLKAKNSLYGPIIIIFSDTLFYNDTPIEQDIKKLKSNIIWTKKVDNPDSFGVVKCKKNNEFITKFLEKPTNFISNLAMVGLYYFKDGSLLQKELKSLNNNSHEFQLTSVLESMRKKGEKFINKSVKHWIDFGDKKRIIFSNSRILSIEYKNDNIINNTVCLKNSVIIKPCFISKNTYIKNSVIGPYVSIGKYVKISNSNITKSLIQDYSYINFANIENSIIGNHTKYFNLPKKINLGDYSEIVP